MTHHLSSAWRSSLTALAFGLCASPALGQTYPSKPVRFVVPFPAGGTTDLLTRVLAKKLNETWGQSVLVENRPGGGTNIGMDYVAKSPPDGYTVVLGSPAVAINPTLYSSMPYDPAKELAPVTMLAAVPNILVVHPSIPADSVRSLITVAKAKPGQLDYASSGNGSSQHMSAELFKYMAKIDMTHVPYKGVAPAMTDLVGGHVTLMFAPMVTAQPHYKAGRLRALAVTTAKRSPAEPIIPTIAESGFPGYEAISWNAILVPARTPKDIIDRLHGDIVKVLRMPDVKALYSSQGAEAIGDTPDQLGAYIKAETSKWAKIVKSSGARVD